MKKIKIFTLFFLFCILSNTNIQAQLVEYNHSELDWYTINTQHFQIHYHEGTERTARLTAKIVEEIYGPVTALYQYEPDGKIHFIIRDHDDFSNGAAFYYDNKVEIWASPMDFVLRGNHNWLRNVITHEFVHMISLGAARKVTRTIPALYIQYMGYEPEKNPYVLYGFPNRILSYPLAMTVMPNWLAEGVAQYQLPPLNYDNWDTHRDMILRTAVLENEMLSFKEMGVFGKTSLGNEKLYNHGMAIVRYIASNYGVETLGKLFREMHKPWHITINGALKKVTGKSEKELYKEWKSYLEEMYAFRTKRIINNLQAGKIIESKGLANLFPAWSPDGKKFAFVSNRGFDYLSLSSLYIHDLETGKTKRIKSGINSISTWQADGEKIYYVKRSKPNSDGSHYNDIYVYDIKKKKGKRLTKNIRARYPNLSSDGKKIIFVTVKDGNHNIVTLNLETKKQVALLQLKNGEQIFQPQWSPDGSKIVYCFTKGEGRKLGILSPDGKSNSILIDDGNDARDPVFASNGDDVYFSWDRTDIYNIYSINVNSKKTTQWTNVTGGAFMPSVNKKGQLLYSDFNSKGYRIGKIEKPSPVDESLSNYLVYEKNILLASRNHPNPAALTKAISPQFIDYDDSEVPEYSSNPYNLTYGKISFLPRIMVDYGTTKIGTYFYSGDVLDKYNIFGGFAINSDMDYDLFGFVNYRVFRPTVFLEMYHQTRHHSEMDDWALTPTDTIFTKFNYRYQLTEVDVGFDFKLNDNQDLRTAFIYNQYRAKTQPEYKYKGFEFPATSYNYFIGRAFQLVWNYRAVEPSRNSEINPAMGREISVQYNQEFNKFINDFKLTKYGTWTESFDKYNYAKLELDWKEYISIWHNGNHALNLQIKGGWIDRPVHEFFNFFAGGLIGLRGYPFYSIEGRKMLIGRTAYRFPVFKHMDLRLLHFYFDKLYIGGFCEYGNAFDEDKIRLSDFKGDAGLELRLDMYSFYNFPTRIFFNAAYGLDSFTKIEKYNNVHLNYGKEWRYYVGVTFGYLD